MAVKKSLKEQLEEAQATIVVLKQNMKTVDEKRLEEQRHCIELRDENNGLRDRLMAAELEKAHMQGYLERSAEDEPLPPIQQGPDRRYARREEAGTNLTVYNQIPRYGSDRERPKQWYHK